jgi:hypothetical protein
MCNLHSLVLHLNAFVTTLDSSADSAISGFRCYVLAFDEGCLSGSGLVSFELNKGMLISKTIADFQLAKIS